MVVGSWRTAAAAVLLLLVVALVSPLPTVASSPLRGTAQGAGEDGSAADPEAEARWLSPHGESYYTLPRVRPLACVSVEPPREPLTSLIRATRLALSDLNACVSSVGRAARRATRVERRFRRRLLSSFFFMSFRLMMTMVPTRRKNKKLLSVGTGITPGDGQTPRAPSSPSVVSARLV